MKDEKLYAKGTGNQTIAYFEESQKRQSDDLATHLNHSNSWVIRKAMEHFSDININHGKGTLKPIIWVIAIFLIACVSVLGYFTCRIGTTAGSIEAQK
ncbi:MAG: hypothetical protein OXE77_10815 [Flavobacteriaceae bacterium]|nr:hypothetical protein [Flavobacteriaceae bacterium]MCY4268272.1 hypothetical protein [Flavobacteriaceae bacterium]MCY4298498.1 hypothetical protein [Flavobacteriaceae bacterium]